VLGGICLLLAGLGLYSVLALGAVRQTREFGIRAALGAQPAQLVALVARRVMLLVTIGLLTGGLLAAGVGTVLSSFLHGVSVLDPFTYLTVAVALTVIAFLAAWLPARRATEVDPLIALRAE
jgi:ABC-type antimicrobial peptide transport system permease subunit